MKILLRGRVLFFSMMKQCKKVGEGVYGEVFRTKRGKNSVALKVNILLYTSAFIIYMYLHTITFKHVVQERYMYQYIVIEM